MVPNYGGRVGLKAALHWQTPSSLPQSISLGESGRLPPVSAPFFTRDLRGSSFVLSFFDSRIVSEMCTGDGDDIAGADDTTAAAPCKNKDGGRTVGLSGRIRGFVQPGRSAASAVIQRNSVTVSVAGIGKSVIVANCYCIQLFSLY